MITKAVISLDKRSLYIHVPTPQPTMIFITTDTTCRGKIENPSLEQYFNQEGTWGNVLHSILDTSLTMLSEQISDTFITELHLAINEGRVCYLDDLGIGEGDKLESYLYDAIPEDIVLSKAFLNSSDPLIFLEERVGCDVKKMIAISNTISASSEKLYCHPNYLDYGYIFEEYAEQFT